VNTVMHPFRFHNMQINSWVAAQLTASQTGLSLWSF
jgi:hypothetical protein